jgi:hypothetical protein
VHRIKIYPIKEGIMSQREICAQQLWGSKVAFILKYAKLPQVLTPTIHSWKGVKKYH